jgi:two-component system response regulator CpxR
VTTVDSTSTRRSPTILIIDDEDYVAELIATALRLAGYTTHTCYNGREGLIQAQLESFDLVIIDIMMPYLNGDELARQLRAADKTRDTPIVLISAGTRPGEPLPNAVFVPKPFDIEQIVDVVEAQISHAGSRQAAREPS